MKQTVSVGLNHLAPRPGSQGSPAFQRDGVADKPHAAVGEAGADASREEPPGAVPPVALGEAIRFMGIGCLESVEYGGGQIGLDPGLTSGTPPPGCRAVFRIVEGRIQAAGNRS